MEKNQTQFNFIHPWSQDCTVYREDIIEICTVKPATAAEVTIQDFAVLDAPGGSEENTLHYSFSEEVTVDGSSWCLEQDSCRVPDVNWKSLVLLVPVRLGGEKFNELYSECLRYTEYSINQSINLFV